MTWLPIWPIKRREMNDLILAQKAANWQRLKALVLDSVSSPITKWVYNLGLDEFSESGLERSSYAGNLRCEVRERCSPPERGCSE